jgi:hypothetical protein
MEAAARSVGGRRGASSRSAELLHFARCTYHGCITSVVAARCTVASCLLLQRVARLHHVCCCSALHGCIMSVIAARCTAASCLSLQRDRSEGTVRPLAADPSLPDVLLRLSRILPRHATPCSEPPPARAPSRAHTSLPPVVDHPDWVQSNCNQTPSSAARTSGRGRPGSYKYSQYGPALPSQMTPVPLQMRQGCAQRRPCLEYSQHTPALSQE